LAPADELHAVGVICTIGIAGVLFNRMTEPSLAMLEEKKVHFRVIDCSSKLLSAELAISQDSRLRNATRECTNSLAIKVIYINNK
jgi:hypothetical protein